MSVEFRFRLAKRSRSPEEEKGSPSQDGIFLKGENGPTLILIHGLTGTPNEMRALATYFNRKGYTVMCPRLANHGQPISVLKKTKWKDFYRSARQACLDAIAASGDRPIFAAGLSMGALLALLLAEEFPDRISGVCCLAPTLFYDGWNVPAVSRLLPLAYFTPLKHFFYFKEEPPYGIKNEKMQHLVHRYYSNARLEDDDMESASKYGYPYFPMTLLCQLRLLVMHLNKRLPRISVPVQLIQAQDDDMTSVRNSQFIYDRIGSKTKEIKLLHDSYHVITADQERDAVARMMDDFFSRLLGAGQP
jgi:carboxylesterase